MPKLAQIVTIINNKLSSSQLASHNFQKGDFLGIAQLISERIGENNITRPVLIADDGECTSVNVDDTKPIQIYHRILSLAYSDEEAEAYGDPATSIRETARMIMIAIADRNILKIKENDLIAGIAIDMPRQLAAAQLLPLNLQSAQITVGEVEIIPERVYAQEYSLPEYLLKPNHIMASFAYQIETVFNKNCYAVCET